MDGDGVRPAGARQARAWDGQADLQGLTTRLAIEFAERRGRRRAGGPDRPFLRRHGGLRLALERPDLVRSLIAGGTGAVRGGAGGGRSRPLRRFGPGTRAFEDEVRAGRREAGGSGCSTAPGAGRSRSTTCRSAQRDYMLRADPPHPGAGPGTAGRYRRACCATWGWRASACRCCWSKGADSPAGDRRDPWANLRGACRGAARLIVPGAGHMVPITHPQAVADAIGAHLDRS